MALDHHLSDYPDCVNIGHAILNVQVVYCPHDQGFTMSCVLGDETSVAWSRQTWRYGPFDDVTDLATDLASYLRVIGRRRLLEGTLADLASRGYGRGYPEVPSNDA